MTPPTSKAPCVRPVVLVENVREATSFYARAHRAVRRYAPPWLAERRDCEGEKRRG